MNNNRRPVGKRVPTEFRQFPDALYGLFTWGNAIWYQSLNAGAEHYCPWDRRHPLEHLRRLREASVLRVRQRGRESLGKTLGRMLKSGVNGTQFRYPGGTAYL